MLFAFSSCLSVCLRIRPNLDELRVPAAIGGIDDCPKRLCVHRCIQGMNFSSARMMEGRSICVEVITWNDKAAPLGGKS